MAIGIYTILKAQNPPCGERDKPAHHNSPFALVFSLTGSCVDTYALMAVHQPTHKPTASPLPHLIFFVRDTSQHPEFKA